MKVEFKVRDGSVDIFLDEKFHCTKKIQKDENDRKYIDVPNLLRPEGSIIERYSFLHRIGDMVEHIRNGWGDVVSVTRLMVVIQSLRWYLDRTYGETLRKKSLSGWKDTEFGWAIFMRNHIFGDEPLNIYNELMPISPEKTVYAADHFMPKIYKTEKDAQDVLNAAIAKVKPIAETYYGFADDAPEGTVAEYYDVHIKTLPMFEQSIVMHINSKNVEKECPYYVGQIISKSSLDYDRPIFIAEMESGDEAFLCNGDALQRASDGLPTNLIFEIMHGAKVRENKLRLNREDTKLFATDEQEWIYIYRISNNCTSTDWYLFTQQCFDDPNYEDIVRQSSHSSSICQPKMIQAKLYRQKIQPIIPTQESPYMMLMEPGKKGLIGRANLRPDEVGTNTNKRKIYFPDNSCRKKLCAGMVRVTHVDDRGNFGFIKGTMVKYSQPSEEDLANWILDQKAYEHIGEYQLQFVQNKFWGSAVRLYNKNNHNQHLDYIAVDESGGVVGTWAVLDEYDHSADEVTEDIDVRDFICQGYCGKSAQELLNQIPVVHEIFPWNLERSIKFISDDFDDAIHCGFFDLRKFQNLNVVVVNADRIMVAASILHENLQEVVNVAKKFNEEAKQTLTNLKRKGKI